MGTWIEITAADGHRLAAWLAEPAGTPRGALVVVQEIFGVNGHIRSVADGYAAEGYLAIAPALFDRVQRGVERGYEPADIEAGRAIVAQLAWENTLADVEAARQRAAAAGKVGIVGYCWGGTVAWMAAARMAGLACAVPYYGGGIPGLAQEQPRCPVLMHWGEKDHAIPLEGVRRVEQAHPDAQSFVYPSGHGFNCDQRASFDAASAGLARGRTLEFLKRHVG